MGLLENHTRKFYFPLIKVSVLKQLRFMSVNMLTAVFAIKMFASKSNNASQHIHTHDRPSKHLKTCKKQHKPLLAPEGATVWRPFAQILVRSSSVIGLIVFEDREYRAY